MEQQQQQVVQQQQVCLAGLTFRPMLHQYIGECVVTIINTDNGIKEPTSGYQNCLNIQMLIFGGYLKIRDSLYARVITWVNTILNHIDARVVLSGYEDSFMVYRPEWYQKTKMPWNTHTLLVWETKITDKHPSYCYQNMCNPHYRNPNGLEKRGYSTNTGLDKAGTFSCLFIC